MCHIWMTWQWDLNDNLIKYNTRINWDLFRVKKHKNKPVKEDSDFHEGLHIIQIMHDIKDI